MIDGVNGSYIGGKGAAMAAAALGAGKTGQAVAGVAGSFAEGMLGGGLGFRGGTAAGDKMSNPTTPAEVVLGQGMSGGNPTTVAAVNRMPPEFQSAYSQAKAANWVKPDRSTWYPPNDGAVGTPTRTTLDPGRAVDRYGGEGGSYLDNPGDPAAARALPPQSDRGKRTRTRSNS